MGVINCIKLVLIAKWDKLEDSDNNRNSATEKHDTFFKHPER